MEIRNVFAAAEREKSRRMRHDSLLHLTWFWLKCHRVLHSFYKKKLFALLSSCFLPRRQVVHRELEIAMTMQIIPSRISCPAKRKSMQRQLNLMKLQFVWWGHAAHWVAWRDFNLRFLTNEIQGDHWMLALCKIVILVTNYFFQKFKHFIPKFDIKIPSVHRARIETDRQEEENKNHFRVNAIVWLLQVRQLWLILVWMVHQSRAKRFEDSHSI